LNLSHEGTSPFEASPNDSLGTPFPYFAGQSVDGRGLAHGVATFGTPYRSICDNKQANQESSAVASQMQQGSIGDTPNQESSFKTPQKNESFKNKEKTVRFLEEMKPCNILSSTKKSKSDLISTPVKGSEIARNFEINYEKEPPPICNEIDFKVIDDLGIGLMKDYVVDESSPFAFQQEFATSVHGYIALKQVAYDPGIEHRVLVHNNKDHHHYSTIMKKTSFISGVTKSQIVNEQKEVWVEEGDLLCIKAYECPSFGVVTQKKAKPKPDDPVETVCYYLVPTDFLIAYLQSKEMGKWKAVFYIAKKVDKDTCLSQTNVQHPFNEQRSVAVYQNIVTSVPPRQGPTGGIYHDQQKWYEYYITDIKGSWMIKRQLSYWVSFLEDKHEIKAYDLLFHHDINPSDAKLETEIPQERRFNVSENYYWNEEEGEDDDEQVNEDGQDGEREGVGDEESPSLNNEEVKEDGQDDNHEGAVSEGSPSRNDEELEEGAQDSEREGAGDERSPSPTDQNSDEDSVRSSTKEEDEEADQNSDDDSVRSSTKEEDEEDETAGDEDDGEGDGEEKTEDKDDEEERAEDGDGEEKTEDEDDEEERGEDEDDEKETVCHPEKGFKFRDVKCTKLRKQFNYFYDHDNKKMMYIKFKTSPANASKKDPSTIPKRQRSRQRYGQRPRKKGSRRKAVKRSEDKVVTYFKPVVEVKILEDGYGYMMAEYLKKPSSNGKCNLPERYLQCFKRSCPFVKSTRLEGFERDLVQEANLVKFDTVPDVEKFLKRVHEISQCNTPQCHKKFDLESMINKTDKGTKENKIYHAIHQAFIKKGKVHFTCQELNKTIGQLGDIPSECTQINGNVQMIRLVDGKTNKVSTYMNYLNQIHKPNYDGDFEKDALLACEYAKKKTNKISEKKGGKKYQSHGAHLLSCGKGCRCQSGHTDSSKANKACIMSTCSGALPTHIIQVPKKLKKINNLQDLASVIQIQVNVLQHHRCYPSIQPLIDSLSPVLSKPTNQDLKDGAPLLILPCLWVDAKIRIFDCPSYLQNMQPPPLKRS
jgi:hypothetical protein